MIPGLIFNRQDCTRIFLILYQLPVLKRTDNENYSAGKMNTYNYQHACSSY